MVRSYSAYRNKTKIRLAHEEQIATEILFDLA